MNIILEKIFASDGKTLIGVHVFNSDDNLLVNDPDNPHNFITPAQYIAWLDSDPARRDKAGWSVMTQHPDEDKPHSRWGRLIDHTLSDEGCPHLKAVLLIEADDREE